MRRFEFSDGKSNKFWEIEVEGVSFTVRYGRIGTDGQNSTKAFADDAKAQREADKLIASKVKKGYQEVGLAATGTAATANAPAGASPAASSTVEAAIVADPDAEGPWRAYAQTLKAEGDPRGAIIELELAGERDKAAAETRAHEDTWLGALSAHKKTHDGEDVDAFSWSHGFIRGLRLSHDAYGDEEFEGSLSEDILTPVLALPAARFLREITFVFNNDPNESSLQDLIDVLASAPRPTLRKLHFGDFGYCGPSDDTSTGNTEISWYSIGDLSDLWQAVPNLRTLITQGGSSESALGTGMTLGDIDLPELRHAEFRTGGLESSNALSIARAKIPKIERLDVWYGDPNYGGSSAPDDVVPLLARTDLSNLRYLGLKNTAFTDELPALVASSPLLPQLEVLDLSMGCLADDTVDSLLAQADAFKHLKELNVSGNHLSEEAQDRLSAAFSNLVSYEQREDYDPEYRGPAVGE